MLAIKHYDIRINSSKGEVLSEKVDSTTVIFDHLDNHSTITYTVSITVVDIKGQRSNSTVTEMTIGMQYPCSKKLHITSYIATYIASDSHMRMHGMCRKHSTHG